jgi:hypothetical protein
MMVAGFALTFHALSRARRLSAADRQIIVAHMRELMKGPLGRIGWRTYTSDIRSPEGVFMEFFYGACGITAGFGGFFFWPS